VTVVFQLAVHRLPTGCQTGAMRTLEAVDLSFFSDAPVVITNKVHIAAPRARVFAEIAGDPAGWGRWFPGFDASGRYETPEPRGVGSVRTIRAFRTPYRETILAWDENERWAFRVDEIGGPPTFAAFAEDYVVSDEGSGTQLTWTAAFRPGPLMRPVKPLAPFVFRKMGERVAANLTRVTAA